MSAIWRTSLYLSFCFLFNVVSSNLSSVRKTRETFKRKFAVIPTTENEQIPLPAGCFLDMAFGRLHSPQDAKINVKGYTFVAKSNEGSSSNVFLAIHEATKTCRVIKWDKLRKKSLVRLKEKSSRLKDEMAIMMDLEAAGVPITERIADDAAVGVVHSTGEVIPVLILKYYRYTLYDILNGLKISHNPEKAEISSYWKKLREISFQIMPQVADIAKQMNDLGYIHNDINAGNVFMDDENSSVVLGDFGHSSKACLEDTGGKTCDFNEVNNEKMTMMILPEEQIQDPAYSADSYKIGYLWLQIFLPIKNFTSQLVLNSSRYMVMTKGIEDSPVVLTEFKRFTRADSDFPGWEVLADKILPRLLSKYPYQRCIPMIENEMGASSCLQLTSEIFNSLIANSDSTQESSDLIELASPRDSTTD